MGKELVGFLVHNASLVATREADSARPRALRCHLRTLSTSISSQPGLLIPSIRSATLSPLPNPSVSRTAVGTAICPSLVQQPRTRMPNCRAAVPWRKSKVQNPRSGI